MSKEKLSDEEIRSKYRFNWWWRPGGLSRYLNNAAYRGAHPEQPGDLFFMHFVTWDWVEHMHSAFNYELWARVKGKFEFGRPWPELVKEDWRRLLNRWPPPHHWIGPISVHGQDEVEIGHFGLSWSSFESRVRGEKLRTSGWSDPVPYSFNLTCPTKTLLRSLKTIIEDERKKRGIRVNPTAGRHPKPLSWRPVELLDLKKYRKLTSSERSQVFKAIGKLDSTAGPCI